MDRMKTICFSLKAFSAKLQRLSFPYRIAGSGFLLAMLLGGLLAAGCVKVKVVSLVGVPGTIELDGFALKEIEMENVRFEPQDLSPSIQPARAYWLRRGDVIALRWDTHEFHWERKGKMCDFPTNASTEDCQVCDFCVFSPGGESLCNVNITYPGLAGTLEVAADPGFIPTGSPQQVLAFSSEADVRGACSNNTTQFTLPAFEPVMSGVYRLRSASAGVIFKGATNGEIKLHVLERGVTLRTVYELEHVEGTNYWRLPIQVDPLWPENFSPNLRVTDIRILKGECGDGSAQGTECDSDVAREPVKPSRITVDGYTDYDCYSSLNGNAGAFINLLSCRQADNTLIPLFVTPTYEILPARPSERLSWWVEFNVAEGADADLTTPAPDPMQVGAKLVIEFTIQAIP